MLARARMSVTFVCQTYMLAFDRSRDLACVPPGDAPILHILITFHCLRVLKGGGWGVGHGSLPTWLETERDRLKPVQICKQSLPRAADLWPRAARKYKPGVFNLSPLVLARARQLCGDVKKKWPSYNHQGAAVDDMHGQLCLAASA